MICSRGVYLMPGIGRSGETSYALVGSDGRRIAELICDGEIDPLVEEVMWQLLDAIDWQPSRPKRRLSVVR